MSLLKNIVTFEKGKKYDLLENYEDGAIRVFQANDFRNEDKPQYTFQDTGVVALEDDILVVWDGSVGQMGFGKTGYVGSTIVRLRVKDKSKFDPFFVFKFLQTKAEYLKRKSTGATIKHINRKSLEQIEIPEMSIVHKLHIANLLSKAENLIAQRKESIALLDEFLKSTFLEMFYTNTNYQNWEEVKLEDLAEKKKGSMRTGPFGSNLLHSEFTETGDVKVLGIDNVVTNTFRWQRSRCITYEKFQELQRYQVFPGDVLISIMATLGRTAVVPENIPTTINSKHLAAITLDCNVANPYFIAYAFHSHPAILRQLTNNVKGAIMDGLNLTIIKKVRINLPPIELQNRFNNIYDQLQSLKAQYQQSLQELEHLYGSLSQRAFRGELQLKENEDSLLMAAELEPQYQVQSQLSIPPSKKGFAKLVLAGKIINECKDSPEFTNIKFQKLQHLAEHLMEADLNLNYYNQAAGPYDNKFMHTLHNKMKQQKWFASRGYKYSPLEKVNEIDRHFSRYFGANNEQFSKLINLLGKASEDQCEIISTLYAVWNDRIIKGEPVTNDAIIQDFFNWSKRKQKYTSKQLTKAIDWMKENGLEPKGFGVLIKHRKKKNAK